MNRITYVVLMALASVYGIYQLFCDWSTNKLLFWVGIIVLFISLYGAVVEFLADENWEIKWILWYLIPALLFALGSLANYSDLYVAAGKLAGMRIDPIVPGHSKDYTAAVSSHFSSMIFPFIAKFISFLVEGVIEWLTPSSTPK